MKFFYLLIFFCSLDSVHAQVFDTLVLFEKNAILFESDDAEPILDNVAHWDSILATALISDRLMLEGHTDEVGSQTYNQKLSLKRVHRVSDLMVASGISKDKIQTNSFGELKPERIGSEESAYQYNRRVTIRFFKFQKMRRINGEIVDEENGIGIQAMVRLTGKNFLDSTMTNEEGKYSIAAPDKGIYKIEAIADDYFFEQQFIKISPIDPIEINLELPKLKIGGEYTIPNFNFRGNMPILLDSSVPTLNTLHQMLANSTLCIEIEGHINLPNQPRCERTTRHYKLSVDRAEMVFDNMVKKGIAQERMLPRGYGNWEMLYPKTNIESEMKENRRVEIKIIPCDSEELRLIHGN